MTRTNVLQRCYKIILKSRDDVTNKFSRFHRSASKLTSFRMHVATIVTCRTDEIVLLHKLLDRFDDSVLD